MSRIKPKLEYESVVKKHGDGGRISAAKAHIGCIAHVRISKKKGGEGK